MVLRKFGTTKERLAREAQQRAEAEKRAQQPRKPGTPVALSALVVAAAVLGDVWRQR